jgi:hypothetical protein
MHSKKMNYLPHPMLNGRICTEPLQSMIQKREEKRNTKQPQIWSSENMLHTF